MNLGSLFTGFGNNRNGLLENNRTTLLFIVIVVIIFGFGYGFYGVGGPGPGSPGSYGEFAEGYGAINTDNDVNPRKRKKHKHRHHHEYSEDKATPPQNPAPGIGGQYPGMVPPVTQPEETYPPY